MAVKLIRNICDTYQGRQAMLGRHVEMDIKKKAPKAEKSEVGSEVGIEE
jgi:hypothetical protein